MGIVMILFWVVVIGASIILISGTVAGIRGARQNDADTQTPLEILKQRYARGDIDKTEYEEKTSYSIRLGGEAP